MTKAFWESVIGVVQGVFGLAMLPTLLDVHAALPRWSSGLTALGLWVIAFAYTRREVRMMRACLMCAFCATVWTLVFVFRPVNP